MSKIVRVDNGVVIEIIPTEATIPSVSHWYGEDFASKCIEAPDTVLPNWLYNADTKTFSEPAPPKTPEPEPPTNKELAKQMAQSDDAALALFEAQAATDEAMLAIYEKIGGTTA